MSMLTLRQVPQRGAALNRFDWPSPIVVPRAWMTALYTASAAYAVVMALVTTNHLHQAYFDAERRRRGIPQLTRRQWELLRLVAAGHTNAQIARRLGLSDGTVRTHLQNIYGRLQVSSRTAAVTRAFPDLAAL